MSNHMIGFPNRIDAGALSGGAWMPSLPLSQLQNMDLGQVARSVDKQLASTQYSLDLGKDRKIQVLSWRNHNFSIGAKYRVRAFRDAAHTNLMYDSGWAKIWPVIYALNVLDWKDESWWSRKYTLEERAGYMTELVHIMPNAIYARYWLIEFDDTANGAGYIQIGRMFISPAWQPSVNASYGTTIGWETKTEVQEALSGGEYFQRRIPFRVQKLTLTYLDRDEAFTQAFEMLRQAGIDQEVLWIYNTSDTIHAIRRRYLARLRVLSPIEYPLGTKNNVGLELKERL